MWVTRSQKEVREMFARYRKIEDLYAMVSTEERAAVVFGVKPLAGFLGEDYRYKFGALPVSTQEGGQAYLLLDITVAGKVIRLAFSPSSTRKLMEARILLLLAVAQPRWLGNGHLMNTATVYKLASSGNVAVELTDENIRRSLEPYGAIVGIVDSLVPRR